MIVFYANQPVQGKRCAVSINDKYFQNLFEFAWNAAHKAKFGSTFVLFIFVFFDENLV